MELVNTTGIPADLIVSDLELDPQGNSVRLGALFAKVTWEVRSSGLVLAEAPMPLLHMEEPVDLGFLPRDFVPPRPPGLELVVLAAAHAPGGRPLSEMTVALDVGTLHYEIAVTGDRGWVHTDVGSFALGPPAEFVRMPLTWERAFGGAAEIWLDENSAVDVRHPYNPTGRGFDPSRHVHGMEHVFGSAAGFPRVVYDRLAPNVEHPSLRVSAPSDDPEPYCWAPLPLDMGLRAKWMSESPVDVGEPAKVLERLQKVGSSDTAITFAHRELRIPVPASGTPVAMTGCTPSGSFRFHWPQLGLVGDYVLGARSGTRPLAALSAVLLPESSMVTITFGTWFRFVVPVRHEERSFRLRLVSQ